MTLSWYKGGDTGEGMSSPPWEIVAIVCVELATVVVGCSSTSTIGEILEE